MPISRRAQAVNHDASSPRLAVAEIFITPLGTGEPTIRRFIGALLPVLRESGLRYQLTAMGTLVEGPIAEIWALARRMHDATFDAHTGSERVVTTVRIDERRGDPLSLKGKVAGALGADPGDPPAFHSSASAPPD